MEIKFYTIILALLLILGCKKNEDNIEPEKDLRIKRIETILADSKGNEPFTSIEELLFDYDSNDRLSKITARIIHRFANRADTIDNGYDEFIHDNSGKLSRRNHFNTHNDLITYYELIYNDNNLPSQVSVYDAQWDNTANQVVFKQSTYNTYTYNSDARLTERLTYYPRHDENKDIVMLPMTRDEYHYDPEGNIATVDSYPLYEEYGSIGKIVMKEEYQYIQQGYDPMFFGSVYGSLYTQGDIALACSPLPLARKKRTIFYTKQEWPETYQTTDFIVETNPHGHLKKIVETYAIETYTRLPNVETPVLLTERGKRESRFEYINIDK